MTPTSSSPSSPSPPKVKSARKLSTCSPPPTEQKPATWPSKSSQSAALYVGGGIGPRILEKLKDGAFMRSFTDKGRLSQLLINMPVRVILEPKAALLGAAAYAETRAAEISGISPRAASVAF